MNRLKSLLIAFLTIFETTSYASSCSDFSGNYRCRDSFNQSEFLLKIEQKNGTDGLAGFLITTDFRVTLRGCNLIEAHNFIEMSTFSESIGLITGAYCPHSDVLVTPDTLTLKEFAGLKDSSFDSSSHHLPIAVYRKTEHGLTVQYTSPLFAGDLRRNSIVDEYVNTSCTKLDSTGSIF